jgi:hypothetical protein
MKTSARFRMAIENRRQQEGTMNGREVSFMAVSLSRWLVVTVVTAVLSPWLALGCFLCLASFLSQDVWSFRDIVTQAAFANPEAWKSGAITWQGFSQLCFIVVCVARVFFSPVARKAGEWVSASLKKWIDSQFSEAQQRRITTITLGSLIAVCLVLAVAASKADHRSRAPVPEMPAFADAPAAAALRLSTGCILSGDADIAAGQEPGVFSVRFKAQQRAPK